MDEAHSARRELEKIMAEMRCPHCGKFNQDLDVGANICLRCGEDFTVFDPDQMLELWNRERPKYGDRPCTQGVAQFVLDVLAEADRQRKKN